MNDEFSIDWNELKQKTVWVKQYPYITEDGIYMPTQEYAPEGIGIHKLVLTKELFVEAYNKWIKGE